MKSKTLLFYLFFNTIKKNHFPPNSISFKFLKYIYKLFIREGYLCWVKLDVNNKCNLKCKFCYIKKGSEEIDLKSVLSLIDKPKFFRLEIMGGEPLLRKDLFNIIEHTKKKGLECLLFTNATLISKKVAADLKKSRLDSVIVTLMSDLEDVHDSLTRTKGSWKKTVKGIKNLVKEGVKTYTHTVIISKNIDRIKEIDRFSTKIGATPLFFRCIPKNKKDSLAIIDNRKLIEIKRWLFYEKNPRHKEFMEKMLALTGRSCYGGSLILSVKSNGDVTPCPFIDDLILGNIKNKGIQEIFKDRLKNDELIKFFSSANECSSCSLVNLCKSGCKAANKNIFGVYNKKDYQCLGPWKSKPSFEKICESLPYWW